jgi:hypothetical protein
METEQNAHYSKLNFRVIIKAIIINHSKSVICYTICYFSANFLTVPKPLIYDGRKPRVFN